MILELDSDRRRFPSADLGALMDRHGVLRVMAALAVAMLRRARRAPVVTADDLPEHLRRDVGLRWEPPSPRHWDIRL
jgi:hypothetical protein